MVTVNKSKLDAVVGNKLVGEASSIGLRVGEWPEFIAVVDDSDKGFLFMKNYPDVNGGEICGMNYFDRTSGVELLVVND